ncbi:MAG: AsmA family protein [Acidobacteriota bacterium]|nr:AsmA family protein [Acidobacteriota bacterium]
MSMTDQGKRAWWSRKRVVFAAAVIALLLAGLLVPPWVSVSRYQTRIAQLISASLGRPVRLSSVQLRLLPRPGFVLTDLTVAEDPAYGAEPVLHANSVTADIRLLSLWRGRLEISRISVDEASLNLVRSSSGRWNINELFRTAAQAHGGPKAEGRPLPYLEATESRINIKNGLEKLPYSLVNADIDLWQDRPGEWRIRLRGQPARTDVSLDLADTGILRVEGRVGQSQQLRQMPIHLEMDWRDAQLGQLSRLVLGSDPGWRGDLRGDLQLDGSAESANVQTRLRATGVHRAEFAPSTPLDFDANCSFVSHYSARSIEKLACDSPLGEGRVHVSGALQSTAAQQLQIQLQRIPAQAALDLLRTLRNGMDESLQAAGSINGELAYTAGTIPGPVPQLPVKPAPSRSRRRGNPHKTVPANAAPAPLLAGSLTVDGLKLTGNALKQPIEVSTVVLDAGATASGEAALTASIPLPAGGESPLNFDMTLSRGGYAISLQGPGAFARLKEMAQTVGTDQFAILNNMAGDPAMLDLHASGPWMSAEESRPGFASSADQDAADASSSAAANPQKDQILGTMTLRNANWKADQLAGPVEIAQATIHFNPGGWVVDSVEFVYGPLKGNGDLKITQTCAEMQDCRPVLHLDFDTLNAATVQAALLGARKQGSALSDLIARWTSASATPWPQVRVFVQANEMDIGPVQLQKARIELHIERTSVDVASIDSGLFGGQFHASGTVTQGDKPKYAMEGSLEGANAGSVCRFLGLRCTGSSFAANGTAELTGFSGADLASTAKGSLRFDWRRGAVSAGAAQVPAGLERFTQWTGDATIAQGAVVLGVNHVTEGRQSASIAASIPLSDPPHIRFIEKQPQVADAKH